MAQQIPVLADAHENSVDNSPLTPRTQTIRKIVATGDNSAVINMRMSKELHYDTLSVIIKNKAWDLLDRVSIYSGDDVKYCAAILKKILERSDLTDDIAGFADKVSLSNNTEMQKLFLYHGILDKIADKNPIALARIIGKLGTQLTDVDWLEKYRISTSVI